MVKLPALILKNKVKLSRFLDKDVPIITAYDKDGLKIVFTLDKLADTNSLTINVVATNNNLSSMTDFLFQAAVPKVNTYL